MKIVVITHKSKNLARTRKKLLQKLLDKHYEVIGICPDSEGIGELEQIGVHTRIIKNDRTSTSIFKNCKYFFKLIKVLKEEKPDVVFSYTIKPIIMGSIAAKFARVPRVYSMVTGMGYMYSSEKLRVRLIRVFCNIGYKIGLQCNTKVIFQNNEDRIDCVKKRYVEDKNAFVIDGSGVDMDKFKQTRLPSDMSFLMIARMLDVKGVEEYCKAAEIVRQKYPAVKFVFVGEEENSYRGVNKAIVQQYKEKHIVEFKGHQENIVPYIQNCLIFVLPSYLREGIPRTLLEALAVGRPIITTDVRGCKETVVEGKNGFLVKPKDIKDLADKMVYMIENKEKLQEMGVFSHQYAKERFEIHKINTKMLEIMDLD